MGSPTARDVFNIALKRREELAREAEALDKIIASYREIGEENDSFLGAQEEQPDLYRGVSPRAQKSAQVAEMIEAARRIVIEQKRPMKRGELVKNLENKGFTIEGGDKNKVFGTNLWRSEKFIAVEGKGYWPKDVALPSEF